MRYPALTMLGWLVVSLFLLIIFRPLIKKWIRAAISKRGARQPSDRCKCGYSLGELDTARCPECGRVIHFDATPEELGLSREELERAQRKRLERRQSDGKSKS
jgi:hypothetical protein